MSWGKQEEAAMPEEQAGSDDGPATPDQPGSRSGLKEVIKRLTEQAYLFVIGLVILVVASLYIPAQNTTLTVVAMIGAVGLATVAIFSVERRKREVSERAVVTASPKDREEVEALREERSAVEGLLEGIVANDQDTFFIYSSTIVDKAYDHSNPPKEIDQPYYRDKKEVTTILDARGIASIYSLLHVAGKTSPSLHEGTAETFDPTDWNSNLILIGSGNSNPKTDEALEFAKCPFVFSSDENLIERLDKGDANEPSRFEHTPNVDHAILAKLKRRTDEGTRVHLVLAGIGAYGTVGACSYLYQKAFDLYRRFKGDPFALIIQVDPRDWSNPREVAKEDLVVTGE